MRGRIVGLMAEASMVVFAVLIALALEEWRQERRLLDFADRARASVVAETAANLQELDDTREGLLAIQELLSRVIATEDLARLLASELDRSEGA